MGAEDPIEVTDEVQILLDDSMGIDNQGDRQKAKNIAARAASTLAEGGYLYCTWVGRCYYCWTGNRWVLIKCN